MLATTFSEFLSRTEQLDEKSIDMLVSRCPLKTFTKGEFLLRPGQISRHSFYVERGLLRYYAVDEKGKEHVLQFAPEGWFVSDRDSLFNNEPSNYFIEAVEDGTALLLDESFLLDLAAQSKEFLVLNNRLLHNHIRHLQNRIHSLLSATAEERYLAFVKTYPDIMVRVPQTMIASYLGITPESLSRVRKELAVKNQAKKSK